MIASLPKFRGSRGLPSRFKWLICVSLVLFLLYNPFLSLIHAPNGLSVQHLSSNRATVGAGELQDFSPVQKYLPATNAPKESAVYLLLAPETTIFPVDWDVDADKALRDDFASNLWFRPPPSA
jgi:hypothetical protein